MSKGKEKVGQGELCDYKSGILEELTYMKKDDCCIFIVEIECTAFPFWSMCLCANLEGRVKIFFVLRAVNCTKPAFIES